MRPHLLKCSLRAILCPSLLLWYLATIHAARSAGSHISQFFDLLPFLGHQKIFYKTCMCAVKVALNFLPIRKKCYKHFSYLTVFQDSGLDGCTAVERKHERPRAFSAQNAYIYMAVTMQKTALLIKYLGTFQLGDVPPVGMSRDT